MKLRKEAEARTTGELRARLKMHQKKPFDESLKEHIGHILDNATISEIAELTAVLGVTFTVHQIIVSTKNLLDKAMQIITAPNTIVEQAVSGNTYGVINVYLQALHDWLPFIGQYVPTTIGQGPSGVLYDVTYTSMPSGTQGSEKNVSQERINQIKGASGACPYGFTYANTSLLPTFPNWVCQDNTDANHMVTPNKNWYTDVSVVQSPPNPSGQTGTNINTFQADLMLWLLSFGVAWCIVKYGGQLLGLVGSGLEKIVPFLLGVVV
jgi:hypothetical protein